jgi:hypothetical protein
MVLFIYIYSTQCLTTALVQAETLLPYGRECGMNKADIAELLARHDHMWEQKRPDMARYRAAYETKFWRDQYSVLQPQDDPGQIAIQVPIGYEFVEGLIASLFAKNPAVVLKEGIRNLGDAAKATALANEFLRTARQTLETCSRMALIYPHSWVKLIPIERKSGMEIVPVSVPPWEVMVDDDAPRPELQKYMAHMYYMTVAEAQEKFGDRDYSGSYKETYFRDYERLDEDEQPNPVFEYIRVVEFYDLMNDRLVMFSPTMQEGDAVLAEESPIPFRDWQDNPVVPLAPFYFQRLPDFPMMGYSAISRIYDQIFEMNIVRSFQAGAVRKASRQYLVKKGVLDEEAMAQVTSGIDGLFIEVEDEDLEGVIRPVPHNQVPTEVELYARTVMEDRERGTVSASFVRGEATKATATEIAALAAYTSSELGRMARERDGAIEQLVKIFLPMRSLYMTDKKPVIIKIDGGPMVIQPNDLIGDFQVFASDSAATPMSEQLAKQQLLTNAPLLAQMGVPQYELLKEVVRVLNLPESFLPDPQQQMQEQQMAAQQGVLPTEKSLEQAIANPSAKNISGFLPGEQ